MQYLIREATRAKNSIQHAFEAAYQPLPDTPLMWCAGWIEPALYTFVSELSCNVDNVPLFNTFSEFFLRSNKVSAIVWPNHGRCTPTWHKPLYYLDMDSASSETGEEEAPPFLSSTADSNIEWPKVVNASVQKGGDWWASLSLGKSDMIGCIVTASWRVETGEQVSP